jgi:hypothetical protein
MATGRNSRGIGFWIDEKRPSYIGMVLLESSSCTGETVGTQALTIKKTNRM